MYTYVDVQPNDSCPMAASQVYKNLGEPFRKQIEQQLTDAHR